MNYENPYKQMFNNLLNSFIHMFSVERTITDAQMECMQFGICDYSPKKAEEFPFFPY